jgi:hypothetical protein
MFGIHDPTGDVEVNNVKGQNIKFQDEAVVVRRSYGDMSLAR